MPWMGKSRWAPCHSTRLINVFVAGMLVFMGIHAAANAAPALKPHRLERSHQPEETQQSSSLAGLGCEEREALVHFCQQSAHHDFVYSSLSVSALVTDYTKAQIAFEDMHLQTHGFRLTGTVSPRGPPRTSS